MESEADFAKFYADRGLFKENSFASCLCKPPEKVFSYDAKNVDKCGFCGRSMYTDMEAHWVDLIKTSAKNVARAKADAAAAASTSSGKKTKSAAMEKTEYNVHIENYWENWVVQPFYDQKKKNHVIWQKFPGLGKNPNHVLAKFTHMYFYDDVGKERSSVDRTALLNKLEATSDVPKTFLTLEAFLSGALV